MRSTRNFGDCIAAMLIPAALAGCGGDSGLVQVGGVLTHKGAPVTSARVTFAPKSGRPSSGETDGQGRFRLAYDRQRHGAELGTHTVSIEYVPKTAAEREAVDIYGKPPPISKEMKALFEKYSAANSKLKVKIESSTRELKIDLD